MIILVDYDNLPKIDKSRGLDHLAIKLVGLIGAPNLASSRRIRIKLYGGWFEHNNLTPRAQLLSAEAARLFPRVISVSDGTTTATPITRVDMGYSLEIEPAFNLQGTFRRRESPKGLSCSLTSVTNCQNKVNCPMNSLASIVNNEECSDAACSVSLSDILTRNEQKLVDTMMVADMIHLASQGISDFAIVSSDDDLWVGIKSALLIGSRVFHMHTIPGRKTHNRYKGGAGNRYVELNLFK
jgi:hypothetical protein